MTEGENVEADPMFPGPAGDPEVPPTPVEEIIAMRVAQLDELEADDV